MAEYSLLLRGLGEFYLGGGGLVLGLHYTRLASKVKLLSPIFIGFTSLFSFCPKDSIGVIEGLIRAIVFSISLELVWYYNSIIAKAIIVKRFQFSIITV